MRFYDTNALLLLQDKVLDETFYISSITLQELENIKTSRNKDDEVKYKARKVLHILNDNHDNYHVFIYNADVERYLLSHGLELTNDNKIVGCAKFVSGGFNDFVFVTDDLACKTLAYHLFDLAVKGVSIVDEDKYTGFIEKQLNDEEMAYLYEHMNENQYGLLVNQYLIIKNTNGNIVDKLRWTETEYKAVKSNNAKSNYFGVVKPYNGDIYQQLVLDSLSNNQITMIKGAAGTGKSYIAIGYLLSQLEKKKIDKIIIFCNTVATANSAKLGYYPGTKDEKLLDSSIGNMLSAKLGDSFVLEQMMGQGKLQLLPLSDIRGFDTNGMSAGVYITEAQNMDISLMKLALQRIGEDSICVIDGDYNAQVDLSQYAGSNNGMRRMSEVFRGQDFYGEIELQNIYRSKIANIAERM